MGGKSSKPSNGPSSQLVKSLQTLNKQHSQIGSKINILSKNKLSTQKQIIAMQQKLPRLNIQLLALKRNKNTLRTAAAQMRSQTKRVPQMQKQY
jgi:hypothetical protein